MSTLNEVEPVSTVIAVVTETKVPISVLSVRICDPAKCRIGPRPGPCFRFNTGWPRKLVVSYSTCVFPSLLCRTNLFGAIFAMVGVLLLRYIGHEVCCTSALDFRLI